MMAGLNAFLDRYGKMKWHPGFVDCTLFVSGWVEEVSGFDLASDLRGTYSTLDEAHAIVARHGGTVRLIGDRIAKIGWVWKLSGPKDGDIGVVMGATWPDHSIRQIPAIHQGGLWLCRTLRGIRGAEMRPEAMWTPPC
jgi:hypothetical protein